MIDLILTFLKFTPVYFFFFLVVGVPWALALLPREDWRDGTTVFALGLALGPILGTTWLFILGTWFSFDLVLVLGGLVVVVIIGVGVVWWRMRQPQTETYPLPSSRGSFITPTLWGIIGIGALVHIGAVIFWPFIYYDTLWSYGYNPRVFLSFNHIPDWIEYYPKMLHLTYSFGTFVNGAINDHAARAAIPWMVMGSVSMAYLLGYKVWGKRSIGLLTAALWFLTPAMFFWTFSGDLEHTVTLYYTGATVFFVLAWQRENYRYAFIAGLLFAGALWTKPTAAAWGLGVVLLFTWTAVKLLFIERDIPLLRKKFMIAATTGLTCIPIGGMWYIRNYLVGHDPIRLPPSYWNDWAQRSGLQFHWLILLAMLAAGFTIYQLRGSSRQRTSGIILVSGLVLLLAGSLPSVLSDENPFAPPSILNWIIGQYETRRHPLNLLEVTLVVIGLGLLVWHLYPFWLRTTEHARKITMQTGLLITPYVLIWFWLYSYHARLMFSFVPVVAAMCAAIIDAWLIPMMAETRIRRRALIVGFGLLGIIGPLALVGFTTRYILRGVDTDREKYDILNPSLMVMVDAVNNYAAEHGEDLTIYTFNEHRMNFFFPENDRIYRWEAPTTFAEFEHTPDILIGGSKAELTWNRVSEDYPNQISEYMTMSDTYTKAPLLYSEDQAWPLLLTPFAEDEGFSHHLVAYEYNADNRAMSIDGVQPSFVPTDVEWQHGVALRGIDFRDAETNTWIQPEADGMVHLRPGSRVYIQLYWQRTDETPPAEDYELVVRVYDAAEHDSTLEALLPVPTSQFLYPDLLPDRRVWQVPDTSDDTFDLAVEIVRADGQAEQFVLIGMIHSD